MTELGRGCASTTVTASVNNMVAEVIQAVGAQELKEKVHPAHLQWRVFVRAALG